MFTINEPVAWLDAPITTSSFPLVPGSGRRSQTRWIAGIGHMHESVRAAPPSQ